MATEYRIAELGAGGDGLAMDGVDEIFIPFTLPGERVRATRTGRRAELIEIIEPSPQRVEPACRHFGTCGGCAMQHLEMEAYLGWKRERLAQPLATRGIEAEVGPIIASPPASRRRVVLSAIKRAGAVTLGYNRAQSNELVAIEECPIARPAIVAAFPLLRDLVALMPATREPVRLTVTDTPAGPDVAMAGYPTLEDGHRLKAVDFAIQAGLARLSVDQVILVEPRRPYVMAGRAAIPFPPGGFLQAVAEAEDAMAGLALSHVAGAKRVADLFAGAGAFSLRLAEKADVHAVEGEGKALWALDRAARETAGLRKVTTERRDLERRPLTAAELDRYDAILFDPPRAGAETQCREIAKSSVPRVAAISCNPTTLARDLSILISAGYRLASVTPIDQFLWSPHVEAVALLEKKPVRKRRIL
jgi:23S rRNA (uracil1939-C5)-methyltransferase